MLQTRAGQTTERVATKFTDADVAVDAVNRAVNQNWGQLQSFLGKLKTGEAEFLELTAALDRPIGYGYKVMADGSVTRLTDLRRLTVYVQADGVGEAGSCAPPSRRRSASGRLFFLHPNSV